MTAAYARRFCLPGRPACRWNRFRSDNFRILDFLRTTWKRWAADGTLQKLFEVGARAEKRMEKQYDDEILRLTWEREPCTGQATATMPRWTHVRPR